MEILKLKNMIPDIDKQFEAVLLLNPSVGYLSSDVYCCFIGKIGLPENVDVLMYLNTYYSSFVEAVKLVTLGEIENLERMDPNTKETRQFSFVSLSKAKETLKGYNLYYYDMKGPKYQWIKA